ncbi:toll-like receptor 5 isoform X2 [Ambystoma mexicanum]
MHWWIIFLAMGSALAIPRSCDLVRVRTTMVANCQAQDHLVVPEIMPSTEVLLLSFNRISKVTEFSFPSVCSIQKLALGMQLTMALDVGDRAFSRVSNITFLDLGGNRNLMLHDNAFSGLSKLEVLLLDVNGLGDTVLQKGYFRDLLSLKKLDLTGNAIQRVRPDASFHFLRMLQFIHLKLNKIDAICGDDLQNLRGLNISLLDLSSNRLSYRELRKNQTECPNPFYNISIDTLDISSNPWNVEGAENFFMTISGTQVRHVQMQHSGGIGSSFGFKNIRDVSAATFSGLNESNVVSLDLSKGFISGLSPRVFSALDQLESLNLALNKINRLSKEAFTGLRSLQMLNLSNNLLGEIYSDSFEGLQSSPLTYLDLKSNHIGAIQHNAFNNLISLQALDLRDNSLTAIPSAQLPGLKHVFLGENRIRDTYGIRSFSGGATLIDLAYNRLQDLGEFWQILAIPSLQYLLLSHNWISRCSSRPQGLTPGDNNLLLLDLSDNSLGAVWRSGSCVNIFHNLRKLMSLNLAQNRLSTLPEDLFLGLSSLQKLDLSRNMLTFLHEQLLQGLTSLKTLRLNENSFATLSPAAWSQLPSLRFLDLKDTTFICHCGLLDLATWLKTTNVTLIIPKEEVTCLLPPSSLWGLPLLAYTETACPRNE